MSFHKWTSVSGKTDNFISIDKTPKEYKYLTLSGHWKLVPAIKAGRRSKIIGKIEITHQITDCSGKGRGGHDGRWNVDGNNQITNHADWKEFGKEHMRNKFNAEDWKEFGKEHKKEKI